MCENNNAVFDENNVVLDHEKDDCIAPLPAGNTFIGGDHCVIESGHDSVIVVGDNSYFKAGIGTKQIVIIESDDGSIKRYIRHIGADCVNKWCFFFHPSNDFRECSYSLSKELDWIVSM